MKKTLSMAVAMALCAGAAMAATMLPDYTTGTGSPLSVDNGGAGSVLFVDYADLGGDNLDTTGTNVNFTVLIDGAGQWRIGDTVEITGFAMPLRGSTDNGTFTFDIRQGSGGIGESGAGGLASIGTATAAYTNSGSTSTMYVNFDTAVSFVVDTNTFKIGINMANTGALHTKSQGNYPVPRYNYNTGSFNAPMQVSVAGNVDAVPVTTNTAPVFSSDPYNGAVAYTGASYTEDLSGIVSDPDNDMVTLSATSFSGPGSDWIGFDGLSVTGTPQTANIGTNEWTVQATDIYGGTNSATLSIIVQSDKGNMIPAYTVGSGLLSPDGETLFVDTAGLGGSVDITDGDGFAPFYTVLIPGSNYWEIGDNVEITGFALALRGNTANGTMTFEIRQAAGGTGASGAGGLSAIGTNTASFTWNGSTDTYYVRFDTPVSFVADANTTSIGINIQNSGTLGLKADVSFPVTRYNYSNGNIVASGMKV